MGARPDIPEAENTAAAAQQAAITEASRARQAINLRVLLELRRRLKSAAEKELAVGADRARSLRNELRRAEAELRLCARLLQVRAEQLGRATSRAETAHDRATHTCARLTSLDRENDDLAHQLAEAQDVATQLQVSVQPERHARHGTLDSFVLATNALVNELARAVQDQSAIRTRMRDLIEENHMLAVRAEALHSCYQTTQRAMGDLCEAIAEALGGASATVSTAVVSAPPDATENLAASARVGT